MITDVHTHDRSRRDAVINLNPGEPVPSEGVYSVGVHPWDASTATEAHLQAVRSAAADSHVVAIGECGLDRLRGGDMARQMELFERQALIAEEVEKPLIVHCVRCYDELLRIHGKLRPNVPWILHGFRGKPEIARRLTDAGIYLSIGEKFNSQSLTAVPAEKLLVESDESALPIAEIASRAGLPLRPLPMPEKGARSEE